MGGIRRRTKRVASDRAIADKAWTLEEVFARSNAQDLVSNAIALLHLYSLL